MADPSSPVVIFDGVCNLCNGFVDLLVRIDDDAVLRFAASQSETGARLLANHGHEAPNELGDETMYVLSEGVLYERSDAVLEIARLLGWPWRLASGLRLVPRPIRDALYRLVARYRYRLLGQRHQCRVPTEAERDRFLS